MKRLCSQCKEEKPITKFAKNFHSKLGRLNICTLCHYQKYKHLMIGMNNHYRFGGNRLMALNRDGFKCVFCSMKNQDHIKKYMRCFGDVCLNTNGELIK